jgi:hypothetical protein
MVLEKVCSGPMMSLEELKASGALEVPAKLKRGVPRSAGPDLFDVAGL